MSIRVRLNAGAGIADLDHGVIFSSIRPDYQFAAVGHGLLGVDKQVQEYLLEHHSINPAYKPLFAGAKTHRYRMALRLRHVEIDHIADELIKVGRQRLQFRPACVAQEIVEYLLEPVGLLLHNRQSCEADGQVLGRSYRGLR